jgi:hypothetical protein
VKEGKVPLRTAGTSGKPSPPPRNKGIHWVEVLEHVAAEKNPAVIHELYMVTSEGEVTTAEGVPTATEETAVEEAPAAEEEVVTAGAEGDPEEHPVEETPPEKTRDLEKFPNKFMHRLDPEKVKELEDTYQLGDTSKAQRKAILQPTPKAKVCGQRCSMTVESPEGEKQRSEQCDKEEHHRGLCLCPTHYGADIQVSPDYDADDREEQDWRVHGTEEQDDEGRWKEPDQKDSESEEDLPLPKTKSTKYSKNQEGTDDPVQFIDWYDDDRFIVDLNKPSQLKYLENRLNVEKTKITFGPRGEDTIRNWPISVVLISVEAKDMRVVDIEEAYGVLNRVLRNIMSEEEKGRGKKGRESSRGKGKDKESIQKGKGKEKRSKSLGDYRGTFAHKKGSKGTITGSKMETRRKPDGRGLEDLSG